jgi:hypothetical protein
MRKQNISEEEIKRKIETKFTKDYYSKSEKE